MDYTLLCYITLPLQKDTSEWDEKTEEGQTVLPRQIRVLSILDKADSMEKEITYSTWIRFSYLIY